MLEQAEAGKAWLTGPLEVPFGRGINFQIVHPELDALHARLVAEDYLLFAPLTTATYMEGDTPHSRWYRTPTGTCCASRTDHGATRSSLM